MLVSFSHPRALNFILSTFLGLVPSASFLAFKKSSIDWNIPLPELFSISYGMISLCKLFRVSERVRRWIKALPESTGWEADGETPDKWSFIC